MLTYKEYKKLDKLRKELHWQLARTKYFNLFPNLRFMRNKVVEEFNYVNTILKLHKTLWKQELAKNKG